LKKNLLVKTKKAKLGYIEIDGGGNNDESMKEDAKVKNNNTGGVVGGKGKVWKLEKKEVSTPLNLSNPTF
jgi:hypothetical protein